MKKVLVSSVSPLLQAQCLLAGSIPAIGGCICKKIPFLSVCKLPENDSFRIRITARRLVLSALPLSILTALRATRLNFSVRASFFVHASLKRFALLPLMFSVTVDGYSDIAQRH